jgi:hypothetical protein
MRLQKTGGSRFGSNATPIAHSGTSAQYSQHGGGGAHATNPGLATDAGASSPLNDDGTAGRGCGRGSRGRGRGRSDVPGRELAPVKPSRPSAGKKRKPTKDQKQLPLLIEAPNAAGHTTQFAADPSSSAATRGAGEE